ncbi:uncharacterized protein LOC127943344 isoform X10 [Carassius gibelio]|uniref:uncharacterized protein LOC127943344 isoform X10 n=1 Tax=Carassius gibelio TaxID=101364 RepID=UPI002277D736|nr:uncharacterized protein LOC127943344 isoform X10 [Carassius gibelio]
MAEVLSEKPSSDFLFSVCLRFHCVSSHSERCLNDHSIEDIHLDHTMKIIQLQIYLLMWSQVTESLTNTAVTLGADVIISCDLDIEEIYWYKLKLPDPPELILRTYSSTYEGAKYENSIFEDKYSVKTNSRLFIRNISADELGVYYCVKTSETQKFSNGTKIYISDQNAAPEQETPWRNLTIITSVLLNVLLIIALIGLVKSKTDATGKCKNYSNNLQCAEIDFSMCAGNIRSCPEQSKIVYRQCMM